MTWVRLRRLDRCRRDLLDPGMVGRSIGSIAASWGLLDPAHFSRAFRAGYGVSPRDYRSAAAAARVARPDTGSGTGLA